MYGAALLLLVSLGLIQEDATYSVLLSMQLLLTERL